MKKINFKKGFTLIELVVVIGVIAILSAIVMFSVNQYVSKGKDSNIAGNLAVLVPAGEVYYNGNKPNGYEGFCDPTTTGTVLKNIIAQMPAQTSDGCYGVSVTSTTNPAGICCSVASTKDSWAACVKEFTDQNYAYCVDSRGVKEEIDISDCHIGLTQCP